VRQVRGAFPPRTTLLVFEHWSRNGRRERPARRRCAARRPLCDALRRLVHSPIPCHPAHVTFGARSRAGGTLAAGSEE